MIATNAFKQAVVGTYTASDTVIELNSISNTVGNADYLPNGGFNLILYDGLFGNPADANNGGDYEILECSSVNYATNEITVVRARENTTAVIIDASSWQVIYGATVAFFAQFEDADATILKQANVVDTLVSTSAIAPLSANQGKELQDAKIPTADIINDLTTGGATKVASAETVKDLKTQLDAKGKVLQVVYASTDTAVIVSTATYTDTTLTATITPSSATSKILVMVSQSYQVSRNADRAFGGIKLLRGSTDIFNPNPEDATGPYGLGGQITGSTAFVHYGRVDISYEDSPATTSATTYKTQGRPYRTADGSQIRFQINEAISNATSTMILMEIEA